MEHRKVLIAEDDKDITEILSLYLEKNNFEIYIADNGKKALNIVQTEKIDIVLIDIMMPIMNGYELIKEIRKKSHIPVIIISAKNMEKDKILGLDIGADAYITKPFNPLEVVANVKAIIRRCYKYEEENNQKVKIVVGELEFDEEEYTVRKNGEKINLTNTETKILSKMMKEPGKIFTREQLYKCINNQYFETDDNTIMVHISNIRSKIKDEQSKYIKTIRGVGYKIDKI